MGFLITFFLKNGLRSRRTIWLAILTLFPVGVAVLLLIIKELFQQDGITVSALYPQVSLFLYLHFLLPLIAVFIGTATLADEVEDRTLPYLITRPLPRWSIVLTKILAGVITSGILILISLFLTYTVMNLAEGLKGWVGGLGKLVNSGMVLVLGLLVYIPIFAFFGGMLRRPVLAGLLFSFGWETTVSFFPGNIKLLTVYHYLHVLFPQLKTAQSANIRSAILDFILPTKAMSDLKAVLILAGIFIVFTAATTTLLYFKEYRLEIGD